MSETEGSSPSHTPAGWYPSGDGYERWWDGNAWSQHHVRPLAPQTPHAPYGGQAGQPGATQPYGAQPYGAQPYYVAPPGSQGSNTARTVLIVIGVLVLLLVGGCVAVVSIAGVAVNSAVEELEAEDAAPGGADNPLEVTVGSAFEAQGFAYDAGWALGTDPVGDLTVTGLRATRTADDTDYLAIDVTLLRGTEQLAEASCSASSVAPGASVELTCYSFDPVPTGYDTVTVRDAY